MQWSPSWKTITSATAKQKNNLVAIFLMLKMYVWNDIERCNVCFFSSAGSWEGRKERKTVEVEGETKKHRTRPRPEGEGIWSGVHSRPEEKGCPCVARLQNRAPPPSSCERVENSALVSQLVVLAATKTNLLWRSCKVEIAQTENGFMKVRPIQHCDVTERAPVGHVSVSSSLSSLAKLKFRNVRVMRKPITGLQFRSLNAAASTGLCCSFFLMR